MKSPNDKAGASLSTSQTSVAAGRVVLTYAAFACLWILLSDRVVAWLFSDPAQITFWSTAKGWLFVAVTSLLLLGLIQRLLGQVLNLSLREREAQAERAKTQQLLEAIARNSSDAIYIKDLEGRYLLFNQETARVTNKTSEQALGLDDTSLFPLEQAEAIRANDRRVIESNQLTTYEETITTVDGERIYLATKGPLRDDEDQAIGMFGISRDITQSKKTQVALRESEERYRTAFRTSPDAVSITRLADGRFLDVNDAFSHLFGWTREEIIGKTSQEIGIWNKWEDRRALIHAIQTDGHCKDIETEFVTKDGKVIATLVSASELRSDGDPCMLAITQDLTARKAAQEQIQSLAFTDPLTGLPNRRLFMDRLKQAKTSAVRHQRKGALVFVDLDDFKTLNDTLGHEQGDVLLQQVAKRLAGCVLEGDTVARLGGDDFVVLLEDLSQIPQEAATQAEAVGMKILLALNEPYQLSDSTYRSTASIGITLSGSQDEKTGDALMRAELAMYQAKAAGRNTLRFYDPQMQAVVSARATMEAALREAIGKNQFILQYQPQVTADGKTIGTEALVRWLDPRRGMVPPSEFIPLAEETGLILSIGAWVLETACTQLARWASQRELAHLTLAVNVSAKQFHQDDFVAQVLAMIKRTGANPRRLKLELTESLLVTEVEEVIAKMTALKGKGVGFCIDDFGTGFSSLSYLKRLPLDQLKIDQGFVRDILIDPNDAAIAKMVIVLADSLGLQVIAEGVETDAQRDFLAGLGCHRYQGFLFSQPLPIQEFEAYANPG